MANVHEEIGRSGTSGMWRCNGIGISQQVLPLQQRSPEDFLVLKQNSILSALVSMGSPPASLSSYFRPCRPRNMASGSRVSAYSRISRLQLTNRFPIHSSPESQCLLLFTCVAPLPVESIFYNFISCCISAEERTSKCSSRGEDPYPWHGKLLFLYLYLTSLGPGLCICQS